jgi:hypothetical protein
MDAVRRAAVRIGRAWRALGPEQRMTAVAALILAGTLMLPWYSLQSVGGEDRRIETNSVSAFSVFSFVEAAVLLVAVGVLFLMFARGEKRGFHLPGGDGTVVLAAGGWAAFLLFYRVLDRPPGGGYPVGIEWGFFVAFVAAAFLAYCGARMRAAHRPEPPLPETAVAPPRAAGRVREAPREREPEPEQLSFDERDR